MGRGQLWGAVAFGGYGLGVLLGLAAGASCVWGFSGGVAVWGAVAVCLVAWALGVVCVLGWWGLIHFRASL